MILLPFIWNSGNGKCLAPVTIFLKFDKSLLFAQFIEYPSMFYRNLLFMMFFFFFFKHIHVHLHNITHTANKSHFRTILWIYIPAVQATEWIMQNA